MKAIAPDAPSAELLELRRYIDDVRDECGLPRIFTHAQLPDEFRNWEPAADGPTPIHDAVARKHGRLP